MLPAASFKSILEEFPDVKVVVEHVAIQKLLELRKQVKNIGGCIFEWLLIRNEGKEGVNWELDWEQFFCIR